MRFRNKILLAIWGVVLGLLIVIFVVINYWMRIQIQSRFTGDLRSNYSTIREISDLRAAEDLKSCQVIAETPRLKAVAELKDANTAFQLCQELNQSIASDLFLLADSNGNLLVELLNGKAATVRISEFQLMLHQRPTRQSANVWNIGGSVFRVASSPVSIGKDFIGTVTIGFNVTGADVKFVKSMTNSDAILLVDEKIIATSLPEDEGSEVASRLRSTMVSGQADQMEPKVFTIDATGDRYAAIFCQLNDDSSSTSPFIAFLLLKPMDRELKAALAPVMNTIVILSIAVLIITGGIGYVISKGISRPIASLVQGTKEVSRGNYDYRITVQSGGEMKFLAQKFEEMSTSLKDKVHQLGERNLELEQTLRQLKETERELVKSERLAATGKLTAQISHEINNPIHNIQSCLQTVLKHSTFQGRDKELLEVAFEEVERLSKLTRQMLDVYRSSIVREPRESVNINSVIKEVLHASQSSLSEGRVEIVTKFTEGIPTIEGSGDKLKQVFLNLVLNAKDAMPDGGSLSIETSQRNGNVVIAVSDTGVGIPEANINQIFDAFFTTKSKVSGVGLGLSVTYGIVKQHNGSISVKSAVGEGTTFTILLPVTGSHS